MGKKKILMVSGGFYPAISPRSFRTTELAKEFARQGHEVVVYIPFKGNNYTEFSKKNGLIIKDLGPLRYKPINLKGRRFTLFVKRVLRRLLNLLIEYPNIELMFNVARCLKTETDYDILISIAVPYPIHWGVALVRSKRHPIAKRWIADCGDPYMGNSTDTFSKMFYFKYIEKWFFRKTDAITVPFKGAIKAYYKEFHSKIRIIPQGFQMDDLIINTLPDSNGKPIFGYAGGFIPGKRDPNALLTYLVNYKGDFKFIVYTNQGDLIAGYKNKLGEKLEIRNYIPRNELLAELSKMNFLINIDNNTPNQMPSKLIDYAITGRPVFNVTSNPDFSVLSEFMDGNYRKKMDLEPASNYDIKVIAEKFVELSSYSW